MVKRALTGSGSGSFGGSGSLSFGTILTLLDLAQRSFTGHSRSFFHHYASCAMGDGFHCSSC